MCQSGRCTNTTVTTSVAPWPNASESGSLRQARPLTISSPTSAHLQISHSCRVRRREITERPFAGAMKRLDDLLEAAKGRNYDDNAKEVLEWVNERACL